MAKQNQSVFIIMGTSVNERLSSQFAYKNSKQNGVESAEVIANFCYYWKSVLYLKNSPSFENVFFRDFASTDVSKLSKVCEPECLQNALIHLSFQQKTTFTAFATSFFLSTYCNLNGGH